MCGYVGFSDIDGELQRSRATAEHMLTALAHRGPDGAGWCRHGGITMAHCALTFVDPGGGAQPFVSASGSTALVFNGEIYNHAELRDELRAAGVRPRGGSDTEVLVELYELRGMRMLDRLRGMYSFVLHDARDDTTVLVRDPMGKKPLYYTRVPDGIAFASELTALLRHPSAPTAPDIGALADYLVLRAFCAPASAVSGVRKVRPGTYVTHRRGKLTESEFWRPRLAPAGGTRGGPRHREAAERFEDLFRTAVARRVTSTDRRLGVLLSGGLDSSAVAAVARELHPDRTLPTFGAAFEHPDFDESAHARKVARHLGTEHHVVRITGGDLAGVVESEFAALDEPLADPSLLPTRLVCRAAREHVRGVLTGDGADELLLGYRYFQAERAIELLTRVLPPHRLEGLLRLLIRRLPTRSGNLPVTAALGLLARGMKAAPEHRFHLSTAPFGPGELARVLTPEARAESIGRDPFAEVARLLGGQPDLTGVQRGQIGVVAHFLRDVILTKTDRGGMRSALELRSPFLDLDLVEYGNSLPVALKLRGLTGKYLLREVAAEWLPRSIVRRTKLGFRVPLADLLRGELRQLLGDTLSPTALRAGGLFDAGAVGLLIEDHLTGRRDTSGKLWALLVHQLWLGNLTTGRRAINVPARPALTRETHSDH
ncbi:asparagine synthase (glutamine-hydrolyzing) [Streptomyces calidiresistens]|uniref:asparagine synthase (glutamine-hydrolyzing) n=1 Tax=Streptomyces calidiresistens TaxID=1485586 RepID=A0A7W3XUZ9_9ACTN|nr:asparagine synthase (glutamine-hydrolyzing) [Streptomyces calidiresistens]MBB0228234.1 asparagine synthase (glutamine-hydrolyzing) [Streptomyces calidiresistens]